MSTVTTKCVNGLLQAGDLVVAIPPDEHAFLIGRVLKINLLGTPEHEQETANETDDVHVDFKAFEYGIERTIEIEGLLSELYGEDRNYDDAPLDDVIMAPESLIRIIGVNKDRLYEMLESEHNTTSYCFEALCKALTQARTDNASSSEPSEVKAHILEVIDHALPLAGYKVMDGDHGSVVIRHSDSDTDYEIRVVQLF